jgi:hypothetical protein
MVCYLLRTELNGAAWVQFTLLGDIRLMRLFFCVERTDSHASTIGRNGCQPLAALQRDPKEAACSFVSLCAAAVLAIYGPRNVAQV